MYILLCGVAPKERDPFKPIYLKPKPFEWEKPEIKMEPRPLPVFGYVGDRTETRSRDMRLNIWLTTDGLRNTAFRNFADTKTLIDAGTTLSKATFGALPKENLDKIVNFFSFDDLEKITINGTTTPLKGNVFDMVLQNYDQFVGNWLNGQPNVIGMTAKDGNYTMNIDYNTNHGIDFNIYDQEGKRFGWLTTSVNPDNTSSAIFGMSGGVGGFANAKYSFDANENMHLEGGNFKLHWPGRVDKVATDISIYGENLNLEIPQLKFDRETGDIYWKNDNGQWAPIKTWSDIHGAMGTLDASGTMYANVKSGSYLFNVTCDLTELKEKGTLTSISGGVPGILTGTLEHLTFGYGLDSEGMHRVSMITDGKPLFEIAANIKEGSETERLIQQWGEDLSAAYKLCFETKSSDPLLKDPRFTPQTFFDEVIKPGIKNGDITGSFGISVNDVLRIADPTTPLGILANEAANSIPDRMIMFDTKEFNENESKINNIALFRGEKAYYANMTLLLKPVIEKQLVGDGESLEQLVKAYSFLNSGIDKKVFDDIESNGFNFMCGEISKGFMSKDITSFGYKGSIEGRFKKVNLDFGYAAAYERTKTNISLVDAPKFTPLTGYLETETGNLTGRFTITMPTTLGAADVTAYAETLVGAKYGRITGYGVTSKTLGDVQLGGKNAVVQGGSEELGSFGWGYASQVLGAKTDFKNHQIIVEVGFIATPNIDIRGIEDDLNAYVNQQQRLLTPVKAVDNNASILKSADIGSIVDNAEKNSIPFDQAGLSTNMTDYLKILVAPTLMGQYIYDNRKGNAANAGFNWAPGQGFEANAGYVRSYSNKSPLTSVNLSAQYERYRLAQENKPMNSIGVRGGSDFSTSAGKISLFAEVTTNMEKLGLQVGAFFTLTYGKSHIRKLNPEDYMQYRQIGTIQPDEWMNAQPRGK
ncbi:MAG: hypothetical protein WC717_01405 [Candidatus Micrarchaeia archaeon]|jgi:hypothetical protein